jgi:NADPH2:quinone reductase
MLSRGAYPLSAPLPFTPGLDAGGVIEAVGPDGDLAMVGRRFTAVPELPYGGFAEFAIVKLDQLFEVPGAVPMRDAVAGQIIFQTAHVTLHHRGRLQRGETVLVLGAAGGVGTAAIQVAKAIGAGGVIAAASSEDKRAAALAAGADHAVDTADLVAAVKELGGADVVVDPVGGDAFDASVRCMKPFGRLLVVGFASGRIPELKVNRLLLKHLDVIGVNWGGMLPFDTSFAATAHADLMRWHAEGHIRPVVGPVYALADGAQAYRDLEARTVVGKPVVTM